MPLIHGLTAFLAALAPALATATYSDGKYTETIGAQEIGSTTVDGTMVYSMNYCTVVHSTQCYTSLSTGGPAPYQTSVPTYGQPGTASSSGSASVPTPTTVSSSGSVENPPATTVGSSSTVSGGGEYTSTSSETATTTPDVPTGGAAMGAAVMGNVFVAAVAALIV